MEEGFPYILAIDSATQAGSVALFRGSECLGSILLQTHQSHSKYLNAMATDLLKWAGIDWRTLAAIAISSGPGSYTGLRIGASIAKGWAYGLEIPLLAVPSLQAAAFGMRAAFQGVAAAKDWLYLPMMDARREEVFTALYDSHLQLVAGPQAHILTADSWREWLDQNAKDVRLVISSDCQAKVKKHWPDGSGPWLYHDVLPFEAKHLGALAFERYKNGQFECVVNWVPFYLKEAHITQSTKPRLPLLTDESS